jgi:serine/threonine protein phosphatase PrpC
MPPDPVRPIINALIHLDKCRLEGRLDEALAKAVGFGNETIAFIAECRPQTVGMSTTLTALALAQEGDYALVNVGDSRTYLLRDGELTWLTRDDSLVQQLLDGGHLTEAQARSHPQRSLGVEALDGRARWTWRGEPDP